jgi:hypothetical protein
MFETKVKLMTLLIAVDHTANNAVHTSVDGRPIVIINSLFPQLVNG